jgi:3'-5' exoribonuclease 1
MEELRKIETLSTAELKERLSSLGLNCRGVKCVLKKRLQQYYKGEMGGRGASASSSNCDFYLVVDFEATCHETDRDHWLQEIIEFPIVVIDGRSFEVVRECI